MFKIYEYIIKFICLFISQKNRRKTRNNLLMKPAIIKKNIKSILSYLKFLKNKVPANTILMIEPNPYHFELMPGFYKYFHKLGYNIEIMAQPGLARDSPFINNQKPLHIYLLSPFFQKKALKQDKTKEYDLVFLNTSVLWADGVRNSYINWLNFEPKGKRGLMLIEHNIFPYVKEYGHEKYINQYRSFTLRGQNNTTMLNPHYFGDVKITKKSGKNVFSVIINEKENIDFLLTTCRNLIHTGIKNFEIIITGRTVINNISEDLTKFIKITGEITFDELWKIYEESDFIISMLNPDINNHSRYKESTTTGTWQTMLGFLKPILIHAEFAPYYHLDESNSIIYKCNSLLTEAIIKCINMTNEEYEELQKNIQNLEKDIFDQSFENLKKSLEIIAN